MDLLQTPFFSLLRDRLGQLSQRQALIAENIANASTPGYTPRDIDDAAFQRALAARAGQGGGVRMVTTQAGHMPAGGGGIGGRGVRVIEAPDTETTLDGNAVVLEDQTMRAAETRMAFDASIALYQKGLQLIRMAARPPGR
jgi:flagellar basal-body rod protein FlgB